MGKTTNVIITSGQFGWTVVDAKYTEKRGIMRSMYVTVVIDV